MEQKIIEYLTETLSEDIRIDVETKLLEESILDSFGIIDLIFFIETTFNFSIPDDEFNLRNFSDVNAIVDLIRKLK